MSEPDKTCARCGRRIEWRRKWARNWEQVRYCSEQCRRRRPTAADRQLEEAILAILAQRRGGATICPSEAVRRVFGAQTGEAMRPHMEAARAAARRLVARGEIVITQRGRVVDPSTARGPIRLRRAG